MSVDCSATILYGWDITDIYDEHSDFFEQFEDNIYYQSAYNDSAIFLGIICEGTGDYSPLTSNLFDTLSRYEVEELNKIADAYYKEMNDSNVAPKFYLISRWW